ncbi:hypothetical protein EII17_01930 [Clostridiales bacterium COT073_COT-073]|nr:hypothetical protein EII17_01930 [Clostridiales bacterium COT073_COT-073]
MKLETKIYDKLKKALPPVFDKVVLYANVTESSFDIHYYLFEEQSLIPKQCYTLAEEGDLDANLLDQIFAELAGFIRQEDRFQKQKINMVTVVITKAELVLDYQEFERLENMAKIKKEWKTKYLK